MDIFREMTHKKPSMSYVYGKLTRINTGFLDARRAGGTFGKATIELRNNFIKKLRKLRSMTIATVAEKNRKRIMVSTLDLTEQVVLDHINNSIGIFDELEELLKKS